jgi:hypothetical protein
VDDETTLLNELKLMAQMYQSANRADAADRVADLIKLIKHKRKPAPKPVQTETDHGSSEHRTTEV